MSEVKSFQIFLRTYLRGCAGALAFCILALAPSATLATNHPMSRLDVIELLKAAVPYWAEPGYEEAQAEAAAVIRDRGVIFSLDGFDEEMHRAGAQRLVLQAIAENYRGPDSVNQLNTQAQLLGHESLSGTWLLGVSAVTTTHRTEGSTVWRTDNATYADAGFLQIQADGTYVWKVYPSDPPELYRRGRWDTATPDDLRLSSSPAGPGLILLSAHDGQDWLVTPRQSTNGEDQVTVARRDMQAIYFWGSRAAE